MYLSGLNELLIPIFLGLAWACHGLGEPWISHVEENLRVAANRRWFAVVLVGIIAMLARVAMLPWMGVPEPRIHDEFGYFLVADTFLHGRLANAPHSLWIFFESFHIFNSPTYSAVYPPAQATVVAIGRLLGHPWIGVLLSASAMCMAMTWMLQGWMTAHWAFLGGILVAMRYGIFTYWANSYWGGAVPATGAALALGALPRILDAPGIGSALMFAAGASLLAMSRPLEGLIFVFPLLVVIAWTWFHKDSQSRRVFVKRALLPMSIVLTSALLFMGYFNYRVTGHATKFPDQVEVETYHTAPIFLWQSARPQLIYRNPEFQKYYNDLYRGLDTRIRKNMAGFFKNRLFAIWNFLIGPALTIPLIAMPWPRSRPRVGLLWTQCVLSTAGLCAVEFFFPHYAAPLMAVAFLLVMLGMERIRAICFRGKPIGVGLARMIFLYALFEGPIYFVDSAMAHFSSASRFRLRDWFWYSGNYLGYLAISILLLMLVLRLARTATPPSRRLALLILEALISISILVQMTYTQVCSHADGFPLERSVNEPFRKQYEDQLKGIPGKHLVLVKYGESHRVEDEFVYNGADIDSANIVWARDLPGQDLTPLLDYFPDRKVWILQPEMSFPNLNLYLPDRRGQSPAEIAERAIVLIPK